jgi:Amt family ammonium transporter
MVSAMNDIVHAMGLKSVAEYVESEEILNCLRTMGVDYAQGFHLGRPAGLPQMPGRGVVHLLPVAAERFPDLLH